MLCVLHVSALSTLKPEVLVSFTYVGRNMNEVSIYSQNQRETNVYRETVVPNVMPLKANQP